MARLTDIGIKALPAPGKGQVIHLDDTIKGFGVRVSQGGTKTFVLTYGADRRRLTIGRYPIITLAQARDVAKRHLAERTLGADHTPFPIQSVIERFLVDVEKRTRPRTYHGYKRLLDRHVTMTGNIGDVSTRKLTDIFDRLHETPQERAHLIAVLKMLFRYAQRRGYIQRNPAEGFQVKPSTPRERTLHPSELAAIYRACGDDPFGVSIKLLMLTGQRRGEVAHMSMTDNVVIIPAEHTKNRRTHTFPATKTITGLLSFPRAFNGWGRAKKRLDCTSVTDWSIHDLRRTYATIHAQLGTPPHVIESLLNHKSGIVSGVASVYNRYQYRDEMQSAVQSFDRWFRDLLDDPCI